MESKAFRPLVLKDIDGNKEGYIYMLEAVGTKRVKIGRSKNPLVRNQQINRQSPYPIRVAECFWTPDYFSDEKYLHEKLNKYRVHQEYFEFGKTLKEIDVEINQYMKLQQQDEQLGYIEFLTGEGYPFLPSASSTINALANSANKFLDAEFSKYDNYNSRFWKLKDIYRNIKSRDEIREIEEFVFYVIPNYMKVHCLHIYDSNTRYQLILSMIDGYLLTRNIYRYKLLKQ